MRDGYLLVDMTLARPRGRRRQPADRAVAGELRLSGVPDWGARGLGLSADDGGKLDQWIHLGNRCSMRL